MSKIEELESIIAAGAKNVIALHARIGELKKRAEKAERERDEFRKDAERMMAKHNRDYAILGESMNGNGFVFDFVAFNERQQFRTRKLIPRIAQVKAHETEFYANIMAQCLFELSSAIDQARNK